MQRLFGSIARLDGSLVPTLLVGETGVGKELVARAIHEGSRVAEGPFVPVNCGALSRELIGSFLFGHRRGAFTGATDPRRGAFSTAEGGTLFLDEVGELPLEVQPALLRALEVGEITPLGDDTPRRVSVRVLAATNRDIGAEVGGGRFREDLYFRLAVVILRIPPLRERPEDVAPLVDFFARQEGHPGVPPPVVEELMRRPLSGNVRELRNAVRAFVALGTLDDGGLTAIPSSSNGAAAGTALGGLPSLDAALTQFMRLDVPYLPQRDQLVEHFTHLYVDRLLRETGGNQTAAAKLAGLDRTYLGRLLAKIGRR
jgi:DNA-binding NtrC family response regulator